MLEKQHAPQHLPKLWTDLVESEFSKAPLMAKMELSCNITFCYYPGCNPEQEYKDEVKALLKLDNIDELPEISENTERYDIFYCTRFQEEP